MKTLKTKKNTYFWNEWFDFIFLPVSPRRKKEKFFLSNSRKYLELSEKRGWKKIT